MILVVEDEPLIRLLVREVLQDEGFQVIEAKDGAEARASFADPVSAVILDMRLPDADGLDLLVEFKAKRPRCPVIMITGHGLPAIEAEARRLGADEFIHKPFDIDALVDLVRQVSATV